MLHINKRANMRIFDGTIYEGKTYLQVRKMLTPEQLVTLEILDARERAKAITKRATIRQLSRR